MTQHKLRPASQGRPLSRDESRARTREALLDTAAELFLSDGYRATSLDRVARRAGYSKGAVYSNFANKEALCLAMIERRNAQVFASLAEAVSAEGEVAQRLDALEAWWEENVGDQRWARLKVEFAVLAGEDGGVREALATSDRAAREAIAALIAPQLEALGIESPLPTDTLAMVLHALGVGLIVQRLTDPSLPVGTLGATLRALAGAVGPQPTRLEARRV